jgi:hypothetical protein
VRKTRAMAVGFLKAASEARTEDLSQPESLGQLLLEFIKEKRGRGMKVSVRQLRSLPNCNKLVNCKLLLFTPSLPFACQERIRISNRCPAELWQYGAYSQTGTKDPLKYNCWRVTCGGEMQTQRYLTGFLPSAM